MKAGEEADNVVYCRTLPCPFPSSSSSYLLTRWLQPMTVCVSKLLMHDWRVFSCQVPRLCSRAKKEALAPLEARLIVFTYSLRPVPHWCYGDTRPPPPPPPPLCGPEHGRPRNRGCGTRVAFVVPPSPVSPVHRFTGGGGARSVHLSAHRVACSFRRVVVSIGCRFHPVTNPRSVFPCSVSTVARVVRFVPWSMHRHQVRVRSVPRSSFTKRRSRSRSSSFIVRPSRE